MPCELTFLCRAVNDVLRAALERVEACECDAGCARCVESAGCKEGNLVSSKLGARLVLQGVLGVPIDADAVPDMGGEVLASATVVEAQGVGVEEGVKVESEE
jgi:DEAD/DEAH box helicase domain-containing protein